MAVKRYLEANDQIYTSDKLKIFYVLSRISDDNYWSMTPRVLLMQSLVRYNELELTTTNSFTQFVNSSVFQ